jgi:hypothetical protein
MGAALGTKLALPDREVIAIQDDGGFQFGPQALWVAARYGISVIYVVVNNESYAAVAGALRRYGGRAVERGSTPARTCPASTSPRSPVATAPSHSGSTGPPTWPRPWPRRGRTRARR